MTNTIPLTEDYNNWCGMRRSVKQVAITKDEWVAWWNATGVYELRGNHTGQYLMRRIDTELPFSLDNIELKLRKPGTMNRPGLLVQL